MMDEYGERMTRRLESMIIIEMMRDDNEVYDDSCW